MRRLGVLWISRRFRRNLRLAHLEIEEELKDQEERELEVVNEDTEGWGDAQNKYGRLNGILKGG